jgi:hypothetical protein
MEVFMSETTKIEKPETKQNIVNTTVQKISSPQGISFMNTPSMQMKKSEHNRIFNSPVIQNKNNINAPAFKFVDHRPETIVQRRLQGIINNSSAKIAQRKEDEDAVQGKFETAQRKEKDEKEKILQGKFETIQRQTDLKEEEKKSVQGKFEIAQRKEDDEDKYKNAVQKKSNETGFTDVKSFSNISVSPVVQRIIHIGREPVNPAAHRTRTTKVGSTPNHYGGGPMNITAGIYTSNKAAGQAGATAVPAAQSDYVSDFSDQILLNRNWASQYEPQIDHIVPVADNGSNSYSNARVLSTSENNSAIVDAARPKTLGVDVATTAHHKINIKNAATGYNNTVNQGAQLNAADEAEITTFGGIGNVIAGNSPATNNNVTVKEV